jgi:hypothetical protein
MNFFIIKFLNIVVLQSNLFIMKKDSILSVAGFILFVIGFMSIFLSLIGLNFKFLSFINNALGNSAAFLLHLVMIITGIILLYIVKQQRLENN